MTGFGLSDCWVLSYFPYNSLCNPAIICDVLRDLEPFVQY